MSSVGKSQLKLGISRNWRSCEYFALYSRQELLVFGEHSSLWPNLYIFAQDNINQRVHWTPAGCSFLADQFDRLVRILRSLFFPVAYHRLFL